MNETWLKEHALTIGLAIALAFAVSFAWKMLRPRKKQPGEGIQINVKCPKCKWQGTVSRYNRVCPKCASKELQDF